MVSIIIEHKGIIDKFIGDAIMSIFGAPVLHEDDPIQAVLTGLSMLEALKSFNKKQTISGQPPFRIGIGINTGEVIAGNIGSENRLEYAVIGDAINLASRLCNIAKANMLLISQSTYEKVKNKVKAKLIAKQKIKGIAESVNFYVVQSIK